MVRIVVDTVVLVRSLINPHGPAGRLVKDRSDRYELVLSQAILVEILEVLRRPELRRKYKPLKGLALTQVLSLVDRAELVEVPDVPAVSRDPKDDKFLATATAGRASYVVSADKDLLDLGEYAGIKIVDPATFLAMLEEGGEDA